MSNAPIQIRCTYKGNASPISAASSQRGKREEGKSTQCVSHILGVPVVLVAEFEIADVLEDPLALAAD